MIILRKKYLVPGALAVAVLLGALGDSSVNALQASAATTADTVQTQTSQSTAMPDQQGMTDRGNFDPSQGGHVGANGKREELLTGDAAEKVKAAALTAVSGGTVERVETDAEGAVYEAHMTKSDGSHVTVKFDTNFTVTGTEDGPQR